MSVTTSIEDGVAVVTLDDGKMNAISHEVLAQLHAALDQAMTDAKAVCIRGNGRALSAGFELAVMTSGDSAGVRGLVQAGAELLLRLYVHPQPTVLAVTGHALAAGALFTLVCDSRIGTPGTSKIGLNEIAIGLALPMFVLELANDRLSSRYLTRATIQAEIFTPDVAVAAGYLDRVETDCVASALEEARRLACLPTGAYGRTKRSIRGPLADRVLTGLTEDLAALAKLATSRKTSPTGS